MSTLTISAPAAERLMTAEEFAEMPDDGRRTELVRGREVDMPLTNYLHGTVCWQIAGLLFVYLSGRDLGRATCNDSGVVTKRDPDSVRGPDVAYFSYQRVPKDSMPDRYPEVSPELIFEVKSPSDRWQAITAKVSEYLTAGTLTVCVADPETRTVSVYSGNGGPARLTADDDLTLPEVFPDFRVPVRRFFE